MPLMHKKSKKAFEHNVETEMDSGKPQDQSLAIAYSVKRKAKKAKGGMVKYAEGGEISASNEKRPMPEDRHNDKHDVSEADHKRSNGQDNWLDQPTVKQAQMNNGRAVKPIKHPSMTQSPVFKVKLRDQEDELEDSANPGPYDEQPSRDLDEEGPDRQGPDVPALHMKRMAAGGKVEEEHLQSSAHPSEDEGEEYARSNNEMSPDRHGPDISDHEEPHSEHDRQFHDAHADEVDGEEPATHSHSADDSEDQPDEEAEIEHHASVAAAIMAKRRMMARGGEILSEDSMESDDSDMADLDRNAEEDANMEDKASFDALRKENYDEEDALRRADHPMDSNLHGDDEEMDSHDKHDMVSAIRRKMKKSPITR